MKKPTGRMRVTTGRPAKSAPRPVADLGGLRDALEVACLDTMGGDPPGPLLAGRLERACTEVLRGRGLGGAQVRATSTRKGTRVEIRLPRGDQRVEHVVLTL